MLEKIKKFLVTILVILYPVFCMANALTVTNVTVTSVTRTSVYVNATVSWSNSWYDSTTLSNWDATWLFVKVQKSTGWEPAYVSTNTSSNTTTFGVLKVPVDGMGCFLRGNANYASNVSVNVSLLCSFPVTNGYPTSFYISGIEMVYVPTGSFYLGSTGTDTGHFYDPTVAAQTTNAFLVSSENAITVGTSAGNLYYVNVGGNVGDGAGTISNAFPKGYNAFYCMKYEISQGQYASFLNKLTGTQWTNRWPNYSDYRYTISGTCTNSVAAAPDRACNYLSWADGAAYADWAGLRPMTELEFEKACRGTANPFPNEYAWGNATVTNQTGHSGTDGSGTETATPTTANCLYNNGAIQGPVRCGIFATASSGRVNAGATYYGIMEMSGNVWERPVTVGNSNGRWFQGTHGNGILTANGDADNSDWPGTSATGAGFRGGSWYYSTAILCVSDRRYAASAGASRDATLGWRGVRTAP